MGRTTAEISYKYKYAKNKLDRWMEFRVFAGSIWKRKLNPLFYWYNTNLPIYSTTEQLGYQISLNGNSGGNDIFAEDFYFSRTNSRFGGNQRSDNMGNFKTSETIVTTKYLGALNYYFQLPIKPNCLGIFADFGMFQDGTKVIPMINTGIGIRISSIFGLYFPLWMNDNLNQYFSKNYLDKIRFTLKLNWTNQGLKLSNLF